VGTRCADHVTPLYPQKLALTSPTGGGLSVGIVRVRTKATELLLINYSIAYGALYNLENKWLLCFELSTISLFSCVKSFLLTLSHKHNLLEADGNCISWRNISSAAWWDLACPMLVQRALSERILLNNGARLWAVTAPHGYNPLFFIIILVNKLLLN